MVILSDCDVLWYLHAIYVNDIFVQATVARSSCSSATWHVGSSQTAFCCISLIMLLVACSMMAWDTFVSWLVCDGCQPSHVGLIHEFLIATNIFNVILFRSNNPVLQVCRTFYVNNLVTYQSFTSARWVCPRLLFFLHFLTATLLAPPWAMLSH